MTAFIALGSNLGDRESNLLGAVEALNRLCCTRVEAVSKVYETAPVGYAQQPDFLNACVKVETELSARALLGACLGIESVLGRLRSFANAPRVIDVDLLLYEGFSSDDAELTLPHPRMKERAFVLVPLKDILPELEFNGENLCGDRTILKDNSVRFFGSLPESTISWRKTVVDY